jgi:peptide/nickel transport system ATP-binding protein
MPTIERRLEKLVPIEGSPPSLIDIPSGCPFHPRCRYRLPACEEALPDARVVPGGHLDRCLLTAERKRALWEMSDAERAGALG